MEMESLRYFKERYEERKPMFVSQESHWTWLYFVLYYFASIIRKQDIDIAIAIADKKEGISFTRN